ncbi:hypothetical protein GCM10027073_17710 [Streptomyces chlorus]
MLVAGLVPVLVPWPGISMTCPAASKQRPVWVAGSSSTWAYEGAKAGYGAMRRSPHGAGVLMPSGSGVPVGSRSEWANMDASWWAGRVWFLSGAGRLTALVVNSVARSFTPPFRFSSPSRTGRPGAARGRAEAPREPVHRDGWSCGGHVLTVSRRGLA